MSLDPLERDRQRLQRATRFFARLGSFDLECPHCGHVHQVKAKDPKSGWNPVSARFTCTFRECKKSYVLGIVAWPVVSGRFPASTPPADQVPGPRELAQMRKEGGGWWLAGAEAIRHQRPAETNLTTEPERPDRDTDEE